MPKKKEMPTAPENLEAIDVRETAATPTPQAETQDSAKA